MSYDAHEAFCLDSFQDSLLFFEDFEGDSVKDLWSDGGTGSAAVVDSVVGGICRITTGVVATNEHHVQWGENPNEVRSLLASKRVSIEYHVDLEQATTIEIKFGLYYDATHYILFTFDDSADANWQIETDDGTGPTTADSGVAPDTDYHVYRIELIPTDEAHFYIDETEVSNSPLTADIPSEHLMPYVSITTEEDAEHYIDVDYCYVRQDR